MSAADLPLLNAVLNTLAATLLVVGRWAIARRRIDTHRRVMLSALGVSSAFLASYLVYHALHGSTRFTGTGALRTIYFTILGTHTILAAANLPLIVVTVLHAVRGRFDRHRRIAKITWLSWLYVSVTGVLIYVLLYRLPRG